MKDRRILLIFILTIILIAIIVAYFIKNSDSSDNSSLDSSSASKSLNGSSSQDGNTIKSNSEIKSALIEKIEPHASYYLEEVYAQENQFVQKGENILKYSNGEYLTAPYDCSITEINLSDIEGKLLNSHYIEISSINMLAINMKIDEDKINEMKVGKEAEITVTTSDKEYIGYVTKVSSTASNGRFDITIEFENDGNIKLGMTAKVKITL